MDNGKDFLTLAQNLTTMAPTGAAQRSAISRAYYAAFNYARHALRGFGQSRVADNEKRHGCVWYFLEGSRDKDFVKAARKLADLESERIGADYNLKDSKFDDPARATQAISRANAIIGNLTIAPGDISRANDIQSGLNAYHKTFFGT